MTLTDWNPAQEVLDAAAYAVNLEGHLYRPGGPNATLDAIYWTPSWHDTRSDLGWERATHGDLAAMSAVEVEAERVGCLTRLEVDRQPCTWLVQRAHRIATALQACGVKAA